MRGTAVAMLVGALAGPALAQDFYGGYDLVVRQHPTDFDPEVVVELWGWTDVSCPGGQPLVAAGIFELFLSSPVVAHGVGQVWVVCNIHNPFFPACQAEASPEAIGTAIRPFAFVQTYGGNIGGNRLSYDNPLHIMDIHMVVDDLTPRDVTLSTVLSGHGAGCVVDGIATVYETPIVIDGETIIRVNGGCPADFDADGELTIFDFLAFQNAYAASDLAADLDGDGVLTLFDFLTFQNAFDTGCA